MKIVIKSLLDCVLVRHHMESHQSKVQQTLCLVREIICVIKHICSYCARGISL